AEPLICTSIRLPAKPFGALTPRPVPLVLQLALVAALGSTNICGLAVEAVPPVNHVPLSFNGGVEAAPWVELISAPDHVFTPFRSGMVAPEVPVATVAAVPKPSAVRDPEPSVKIGAAVKVWASVQVLAVLSRGTVAPDVPVATVAAVPR